MNALRFATVVLCGASFALYAVAIKAFFVRPVTAPRLLMWLQRIGLCGSLVHLWLVSTAMPTYPWSIIGFAIYVAGLGLFLWAVWTTRMAPLPIAFSDATPQRLVKTGPFMWLSHPFYTAYTATWIAGVISTRSVLGAAVALPMLVLYVIAARQEDDSLRRAGLVDARGRRQTTSILSRSRRGGASM
jgi:protein-S-isoprenylcysteine O-methyltransferase Ste14